MFRKNIKLTDIKISEDRRPVHYETVKGIAESFKAVGQLQPIAVDEADNLVFGRHRVEAARLCEWNTIEANVVECGPEADLMEADENLQRHGLDQLQFSLAVKRRKRAWEEINGRKVAPGRPKNNSDNVSQLSAATFAEETAEMHGVSTRTVERAVAIAENLTEAAVEILADTPAADKKGVLAQVAALPAAKQPAAARRAAAGKSVKKPKAEGAVVDSLKGVVDKSLESVFTFAAEWSKLKSALSTAKGLLTKIIESDTAGWLDGQECERHIAQARALLSFAMPFTECCKCRRKPTKECSHCKGKGWLTKANFTACASDADKAWLDKRAKA